MKRISIQNYYFQAVQEFTDLVEEDTCSEEDVKALLPFWPRIFSKLSTDNDKRVREATQKAQLKGQSVAVLKLRVITKYRFLSSRGKGRKRLGPLLEAVVRCLVPEPM